MFNDNSLQALCKEHLLALAPYLQEADKAEMWAAYRLPALKVLEFCWQQSSQALALLRDGEVVAVSGIEPQSLLGRCACVWSWTGQAAGRYPKFFYRASRQALAYFQTLYPQLYAACDVRYTAAQRYLRHLGAVPDGKPFYLCGRETCFLPYRFIAKNQLQGEKLWEEQ